MNRVQFSAFLLILVAGGWTLNTSTLSGSPEIPAKWPSPVFDFREHPLQRQKIALGRVLFYDPILSRDSSISCASCHSPYNAFAHTDHALSHGIGDSIGRRNAPALQLLAWQPTFMWDGRFISLDEQSLFPITHPGEMGQDLETLVRKLQRSPLYRRLSYSAYGDSMLEKKKMQEAIRQFLLTLVPTETRYDSVMRDERVFTLQEKNGYRLFRKNCNSCHTEPLFSRFAFERNGLTTDPKLNDLGKMEISGDSRDSLRFKVPSLRNLRYSYPYMHDGRFRTLREVIEHYTRIAGSASMKGTSLQKPLLLTDQERTDLIAFLQCLNDSKFIFEPSLGFPRETLH